MCATVALGSCSQPVAASPQPVTVLAADPVAPIGERLGALLAEGTPNVRLVVRKTNATAAIQSLRRGDAEAAIVDDAIVDQTGLNVLQIAREPVAVIVNPKNPIVNMSSELLSQLYSGRLRDWSEVGGPETPIVLYSRENGDGSRAAFERVALRGRPVAAAAVLAPSEPLMVQRVAGVLGGIGYIGLGGATDAVKIVPIDHKLPATDGTYPLVRPVYLVTRAGAGGPAKALMDLAQTEPGKAAIAGR
jgi:phosphate transport system substrate-binding protein